MRQHNSLIFYLRFFERIKVYFYKVCLETSKQRYFGNNKYHNGYDNGGYLMTSL